MTVTVKSPFTVMLVLWGCLAQGTHSGVIYPPASPETDMGVTCSPVSRDVTVCRLKGIIRGHADVNVTVTVNGCHQPVDVTFRLTSSQNLSWNFTFVPNNQNERVYIPGVYLVPPVPVAPTYLYVREPEQEYRNRNQSTEGAVITVEASLVAVLSNDMWEEEEFLNHTFQLPPHCPRRGAIPPSSSPFDTWLTRGLVLGASLTGLLALAAVVTMKRQQLLALLTPGRQRGGDDLTLVQHLEQQQHTQPPPPGVLASKMDSSGDSKTVINENNNVMDVEDRQPSDVSTNPTSRSVEGMTQSQAGEGQDDCVSVIMESYDLGSKNTIQSAISDSGEIVDGNVQRNLIGKMKKLKESFRVGLQGITFEALKEDKQSLPRRENPENPEEDTGVVIANPLFKSKLDDDTNNSVKNKNEMLPLDDDLPNDAYLYNRVKMGNRSDSYSNIYHHSRGEGTSDVMTAPQGISSATGKLDPMANKTLSKFNDNNNEVLIRDAAGVVHRGGGGGGGIISHAAKNGFGYGSREWLDELEGATAVAPQKHATGKKNKRSQKITNSTATNAEGSKRGGHEERKNKARRVLSEKGVTNRTAHVHSSAANGKHSGAARRSTGGSTRQVNSTDIGQDARKIVKEVLDNGVFEFNHDRDRSNANGDTSLTNGHAHHQELAGPCHPLTLKGLQSGGVRPKTSWAQASVAS